MTPFNALILAGQRQGPDPVAIAGGESHKSLVRLLDTPMLRHVTMSITSVAGLHNLYVISDREDILEKAGCGNAALLPPADSPAASLVLAIEKIGLDIPLLITTGDHPLLTDEMIRHLFEHADKESDLAVGLAPAELVLRKYPGAIRTYYRFAGKGYSGCNLFLARKRNAIKVAQYWRQMEPLRKKPLRLVLKVGPLMLLSYLAGFLTLERAFSSLSRKIGARISPVIMPMAEAAIDVDKPEDLDLAIQILKARH